MTLRRSHTCALTTASMLGALSCGRGTGANGTTLSGNDALVRAETLPDGGADHGAEVVAPEAPAHPGTAAGVAVEDLTPTWPVAATGHPDKPTPSHYHRIEARAMAVSGDGPPVVFVTADVVVFCPDISDRIYQGVAGLPSARRAGLTAPEQQIVLNASHTHSGPAICFPLDVWEPGQLDPRYQTFFINGVVRAIDRALSDMRPARLSTADGSCDVCINRDGEPVEKYSLRPDPDGQIDRRVRLLIARDATGGAPRAVLAAFGCHPSDIQDGIALGADFFGFARDEVESQVPGLVVLTAQGTGGDVRLAHYGPMGSSGGFGGSSSTDLGPNREFGRKLGTAIVRALGGDAMPVRGPIRAGLSKVQLPIGPADSRATAEVAAAGQDPDYHDSPLRVRWGRTMLGLYDRGEPFPREVGPYAVRAVQFGNDLTIAALDGEIFTCIGRQIEAAFAGRRIIVLGYTNDSGRYIPCRENFSRGEGGYEVNIYWGWLQPARFDPGIDEVIVGETVATVKRLQAAR